VTFGAFVLCLSDGHAPATLTSVRPQDLNASPFTAFLREVTPAMVTAVKPRERPNFAPHGAANGSPPAFNEPYVDKRFPVPGSYSAKVAGTRITETCDEAYDVGVVNLRQIPRFSSTELMLAIPSDERGAEANGFVIDYTVGGKKYRRNVPWRMVVCDAARTLHHCDGAGEH
jgi:hypothetical protein